MSDSSGLLLVGAVAAVGVLHTIVPDHWVPITLIARQRGWSKAETARAALKAGAGHVLSTLAIALVIWIGGVALATRFGHWVDTIASVALIGFGTWIAIGAWRDLYTGHGHSHDHGHGHSHDFSQLLETRRTDGNRQTFTFKNRGDYWESAEETPEPHQFAATLTMDHEGHEHSHEAHGHERPHPPKTKNRTALLLILGSSPMVEGIPAFFAAGKYGVGLIILMSVVFAATTIATYVLLCVYSVAGLRRVSLGPLERYGEVLSGGFIALVGLVFWIWPIL
jgi:nickel/cobalt transporter (NicO) family protein